jgi:succinate dehydrogenase / fumarate reductase cytochrome b subunit
MAANPQSRARRHRPLSPHFTVYHWPITMATSIAHRLTGIALSLGTVLLAWWLVAAAGGPESFQLFNDVALTLVGQIILFGLVWSLAYHLLAGLRHLAWDFGYGFELGTANRMSIVIIALSILLTLAAFAAVYLGKGGYLQ